MCAGIKLQNQNLSKFVTREWNTGGK